MRRKVKKPAVGLGRFCRYLFSNQCIAMCYLAISLLSFYRILIYTDASSKISTAALPTTVHYWEFLRNKERAEIFQQVQGGGGVSDDHASEVQEDEFLEDEVRQNKPDQPLPDSNDFNAKSEERKIIQKSPEKTNLEREDITISDQDVPNLGEGDGHVHGIAPANANSKVQKSKKQLRQTPRGTTLHNLAPVPNGKRQDSKIPVRRTSTIKKPLVKVACPAPVEEDWSKVIKPRIPLDPNRFLFPVLTNGPNNQIESLWQSVYLAIRLNRTLVMPEFHVHKIVGVDDKPVTSVPDHWRIDIHALRQLISVVQSEQLASVCHGKINAVFLTREESFSRHCSLFSDSIKFKVDFMNPEFENMAECKEKGNSAKFAPRVDVLPRGLEGHAKIDSDVGSIGKAYGTDKRCAIFPYPWKTISVQSHQASSLSDRLMSDAAFKELARTDDQKLFSVIVERAKLPAFSRQIATSFTNAVKGKTKSLVAVHWRFDPVDWQITCRRESPGARAKLCSAVENAKPEHIARGIAQKVQEVIGDNREKGCAVYIAGPPASMDVIKKLRTMLFRKWKITVHIADDVIKYFQYKYKSCEYQIKENNEVLSLIEMQISILSDAFMFAVSSSWSNNVRLYRSDDDLDSDVLKYVVSAMRGDFDTSEES